MAPANNTLRASIPSLAAIEQRRRELLAWQAAHRAPSADPSNNLGPAPHCTVGATRHGLNLFVVLVGESSKARKGTSWRQIASLFSEVDPLWVARRITTARPTAHGITRALRDQEPPTDRRLFLLAEEFASVLHMLGQRTGELSPLLRCAWDGLDLSTSNGSYFLQATNPHLSIVAHITGSELAQHLTHRCD